MHPHLHICIHTYIQTYNLYIHRGEKEECEQAGGQGRDFKAGRAAAGPETEARGYVCVRV
jgi:hypothetical protein